jgi:hypothetical protein
MAIVPSLESIAQHKEREAQARLSISMAICGGRVATLAQVRPPSAVSDRRALPWLLSAPPAIHQVAEVQTTVL